MSIIINKNQPTSLNYREIDSGIGSQNKMYNMSNISQSISTFHSELNQINIGIERLSSDDPFFNRFHYMLNNHGNCLVAILEVALKTIEISALRGSNLLLIQKLTSDAMDKLQKLISQLQNMSNFLQTLDAKTGKDNGVDLNNINNLIVDQATQRTIKLDVNKIPNGGFNSGWGNQLINTKFGLWLIKNGYVNLVDDYGKVHTGVDALDILSKNEKDNSISFPSHSDFHGGFIYGNLVIKNGWDGYIDLYQLANGNPSAYQELQDIIKGQNDKGKLEEFFYGDGKEIRFRSDGDYSLTTMNSLFEWGDESKHDIVMQMTIKELNGYLDVSKFDDDGILKNFCQNIDYIDPISHNKGTRSSISIVDFKHYMLWLMSSSIAVLNDIPGTFSTLLSNFEENTQANMNESTKNLNSVLKDNLQPQVNKIQEDLKSIQNQVEKANSDYMMLLSRLYN